MARPKKRTAPTAESKSSGFLDALKFLGQITTDKGATFETHVKLENNTAIAFNGVLAAGVKIEEDIRACPHNQMLIAALSKCGEHLSITQLDNNRLAIKSDKFKAVVPCIDPQLITASIPDQPVAIINDDFKTALEAVSILTNENAQHIYGVSILMDGKSCIATEAGKVIFEYWHGIDLPPKLTLPKSLAQALIKTPKKLAKFGFSQTSATFYFQDDSWIRTQFFAQQWPNISHVLNVKANAWPIPNDFYKALEAVAPFSEDGNVYFDTGVMRSHANEGVGASYEIYGLPRGPIFSARQLSYLKPWATTIDFIANGPGGKCLMFYGDRIRGAIAGRSNNDR